MNLIASTSSIYSELDMIVTILQLTLGLGLPVIALGFLWVAHQSLTGHEVDEITTQKKGEDNNG